MFVKPAPGRIVRDPVSKVALPETGKEVPDFDMYWARRLRDGDVVEATPPAPQPATVELATKLTTPAQ